MIKDSHAYKPVPAKVVKITDEAPGIKTFRLKFERPADRKAFSFMPGQFGLFSLMGIGEATFSMCSPPSDDEIEISVRNVGSTTNAMFKMKKGDIVKIYEDPITETRLEGKAKLILFIQNLHVNVEYWKVKFISDGFITTRSIKIKEGKG